MPGFQDAAFKEKHFECLVKYLIQAELVVDTIQDDSTAARNSENL